MTNPIFTRRNALLTGLFGSGYVGLKAMATGLPAWFLANPKSATAQSLECAVAARESLQYLIVSASSAGDPLNCNCPGTYDGAASLVVHPEDATMAPAPVTLGGVTHNAALPWSTLDPAALGRTAFFHHVTLANNHGDQPKVMRMMGALRSGEMLVSAYAKHLAACLGTVQPEPVAVGARGNASELVSFGGRSLPSISPTQLRQLLTGSAGGRGGGRGGNVLLSLRTLRDQHLDQLNVLARSDSTGVQAKFLDAFATSGLQVRSLAESLATTLTAIDSDDTSGQALAAAALLSANVTPVVTVRISFGGDNHEDAALAAEVADHTDLNARGTGVAGINAVLAALAGMGLSDRVTFATLNVFGRNLNGLDKTEERAGRDHYGNHSVAVMIGKNVRPGVIGGVMPVADRESDGALGAADIDSATGVGIAGGDVPRTETHVSMARTLGAAIGIPQAVLEESFVQGVGGKVIPSALVGPVT